MATDAKTAKAAPAPAKEAAVKQQARSAPDAAPVKDAAPAKDATPAKAEAGAGAASSGYSRGEGQKPVTQAYKDNWNAIFGKKANKKKKKR